MWFFPSGRTARVGVGVPAQHAASLRELLGGFLGRLSGEGRIYREGILGYSGGPVPVGGLPSSVQSGPALLAGDAAGCADPVTGSGIYAAVLSGMLAGRMASEALSGKGIGHLSGYRRALERVLWPRHEGAGMTPGLRAWEDSEALAERAWGVAEYEEEP
jgi:flavin-dependent dehydrogenase